VNIAVLAATVVVAVCQSDLHRVEAVLYLPKWVVLVIHTI